MSTKHHWRNNRVHLSSSCVVLCSVGSDMFRPMTEIVWSEMLSWRQIYRTLARSKKTTCLCCFNNKAKVQTISQHEYAGWFGSSVLLLWLILCDDLRRLKWSLVLYTIAICFHLLPRSIIWRAQHNTHIIPIRLNPAWTLTNFLSIYMDSGEKTQSRQRCSSWGSKHGPHSVLSLDDLFASFDIKLRQHFYNLLFVLYTSKNWGAKP